MPSKSEAAKSNAKVTSKRGRQNPPRIAEEEADPEVCKTSVKKSVSFNTDPKRPFSNWRCLWNPVKASDPNFSEPYAFLEVTIERGFSLVASDITTSDPYCKLELNGEQTGFVTQVAQQTLAPIWNETFEVPIYHPLSILSITVYDQDFGTTIGDLDLLGLDDDFIGFLDVHLGKLPHNKKFHGWFELESSEAYADSVLARKYRSPKYGCGSLLLSLTMKVSSESRELFALALPKPYEGHGLPALDIVSAFDRYADMKQYAADILQKVEGTKKLVDRLPQNRWMLMIIALFFVWNPSFLPAVVAFLADAAAWYFWFSAVSRRRRRHGRGFIITACKSIARAIKEVRVWITTGHVLMRPSKRASGELREPLLDSDNAAGCSPLGSAPPKRKMAPVDKATHVIHADKVAQPVISRALTPKHKQAHDMGSALANLQPFMSGENKMDIRRLQKLVTAASEHVDLLDELMEEDGKLFVICASLTFLSIALVYLHFWTGQALEIVLSFIICFATLKDSLPVRSLHAIAISARLRARRRRLRLHVEHQPDVGIHKVNTVASRHLSDIQFGHWCQHCFPKVQKLEQLETGIGHAHNPVRKSYVEPTWCNGCGRFLWGLSSQGYQCRWCEENFCKACSIDAKCESGPRTCEAPMHSKGDGTVAKDTISCSSGASSVMSRSDTSRWA